MSINRTVKPAPKGELIVTLPQVEKHLLKQNIPAYIINKRDLPVVNLRVIINCGSKADLTGKTGLAYLTAMLLDEGAGGLSTFELDAEFEKLGTGFSITTSQDSVYISLLTLNENLDRSLELLGKVLNKPEFSTESFENEHHKLVNKIMRKNDDPGYLANNAFENHLFKGTGYEHPVLGYSDDVKNLVNEEVKKFYSDYFAAENMTIVSASSVDSDELVRKIEDILLPVNTGGKTTDKVVPPAAKEGRFIFVHKENAAQSEIRMGHLNGSRTDKDYYAKILLNTAFGGQFSSRLNHNLREVKGYTYGIHSGFNYYREAGFFEIATSVQSEVTHPAFTEIMNELNGLAQGITKEEIDFAKSYLSRRYPSMFETYGQLINHLTSMVNHELPIDYFNTYLDYLMGVTNDEVQQAVSNISLTGMNTVIVGNKETALKGFENISDDSFGEGTVKDV